MYVEVIETNGEMQLVMKVWPDDKFVPVVGTWVIDSWETLDPLPSGTTGQRGVIKLHPAALTEGFAVLIRPARDVGPGIETVGGPGTDRRRFAAATDTRGTVILHHRIDIARANDRELAGALVMPETVRAQLVPGSARLPAPDEPGYIPDPPSHPEQPAPAPEPAPEPTPEPIVED